MLVTPASVPGPAYTELIAETFSLALHPGRRSLFYNIPSWDIDKKSIKTNKNDTITENSFCSL